MDEKRRTNFSKQFPGGSPGGGACRIGWPLMRPPPLAQCNGGGARVGALKAAGRWPLRLRLGLFRLGELQEPIRMTTCSKSPRHLLGSPVRDPIVPWSPVTPCPLVSQYPRGDGGLLVAPGGPAPGSGWISGGIV